MSLSDDVLKAAQYHSAVDQLRDAVRSPLAEINATRAFAAEIDAIRAHDLVYESSIDRLSTAMKEALPDVGRPSATLPEADSLRLASGIQDLNPTGRLLEAVREHEKFTDSVKSMAAGLQTRWLNAESLVKRSLALGLSERISSLIPKFEVPEVTTAIDRLVDSAREDSVRWSENQLEKLITLTRGLELHDLGNAALQLSMQPGSDAMAWLEPALSAITEAAVSAQSRGFEDYLRQWEAAMEIEELHSDDGELSPSKLRVLIDILFLMLAIFTYVDNKGTEVKLVELQQGQASIVQLLAEQAGANEELREKLEENRQALDQLSAAESKERHAIRSVKENLKLRALPSLDAEVLFVIPQGSLVQVVEDSEAWSRVRVVDYSTGQPVRGWVAAEFLRPLQSLSGGQTKTDD